MLIICRKLFPSSESCRLVAKCSDLIGQICLKIAACVNGCIKSTRAEKHFKRTDSSWSCLQSCLLVHLCLISSTAASLRPLHEDPVLTTYASDFIEIFTPKLCRQKTLISVSKSHSEDHHWQLKLLGLLASTEDATSLWHCLTFNMGSYCSMLANSLNCGTCHRVLIFQHRSLSLGAWLFF